MTPLCSRATRLIFIYQESGIKKTYDTGVVWIPKNLLRSPCMQNLSFCVHYPELALFVHGFLKRTMRQLDLLLSVLHRWLRRFSSETWRNTRCVVPRRWRHSWRSIKDVNDSFARTLTSPKVSPLWGWSSVACPLAGFSTLWSFLWEYIKILNSWCTVYLSLGELKNNICVDIVNIVTDMFYKKNRNFRFRFSKCIDQNGGHLQHIIFKKEIKKSLNVPLCKGKRMKMIFPIHFAYDFLNKEVPTLAPCLCVFICNVNMSVYGQYITKTLQKWQRR